MTLSSPEPLTTLLAIALLGLFYALGFGPALVVVSRCGLPARYVGPMAAACTTLVAYAIFWIGYLEPTFRSRAVAIAALASLIVAAVKLRDAAVWQLVLARDAWLGPLTAALVTGAYLGFLFSTNLSANFRFTWELPGDNIIPMLVASRTIVPKPLPTPPPPLWPDMRASERPPLQAAVVVALSPLTRGILAAEYQIVGTLCQTQWVGALLLLAAACRASRRETVFVIVGCVCSGFFFVNSVFTWPKLLGAWLFILAIALLVELGARTAVERCRSVLVSGALVTLSLLSHVGALFSLVTLPVLLGRDGCRRVWCGGVGIGGSALIAALLLAPWIAYQQLVDPPIDRIAKLHLAGIDAPDTRTLMEAVRASYAQRTVAEHVVSRFQNLATQLGSADRFLQPDPWAWAQRQQFFHQVAALGPLAIGWLLLVGRRRGAPPDSHRERAIRSLVRYSLVTLVVWVLPLFVGGAAIIHSGSYTNTALLFFLGAIGLARLRPHWIGNGLLALHVAVFALVWVLPHVPAPVRDTLQISLGDLVTACIYLGGAFLLLRWVPVSSNDTVATSDGINFRA